MRTPRMPIYSQTEVVDANGRLSGPAVAQNDPLLDGFKQRRDIAVLLQMAFRLHIEKGLEVGYCIDKAREFYDSAQKACR